MVGMLRSELGEGRDVIMLLLLVAALARILQHELKILSSVGVVRKASLPPSQLLLLELNHECQLMVHTLYALSLLLRHARMTSVRLLLVVVVVVAVPLVSLRLAVSNGQIFNGSETISSRMSPPLPPLLLLLLLLLLSHHGLGHKGKWLESSTETDPL